MSRGIAEGFDNPKLAINGGTPVRTRPFAPACLISGREKELLLDCLESQQWSSFRAGASGFDIKQLCRMTSSQAADYGPTDIPFLGGKYVRRLEHLFTTLSNTHYAVSANSATSCLAMALGALNLGPGDEVLVPSMSFHATATSVLHFNSVPVFVEVKPDTLCIDPVDAAARINARTKAIVVVHLGGNCADMDAIVDLARRHSLKIIEDCAQAPGVKYKGRAVGSIGDVGVFSLTETKNINCGEGGVLVTNDPGIALKARLIRNHGEGVTDASWSDDELANIIGMNFRLTEFQAAVAVAQMDALNQRNEARNECAFYLIERLAKYDALVPQKVEDGAGYVCYVLKWLYRPAPGMPDRDLLAAALGAEGIPVIAGYARMMHEHPLFARRIAYGSAGFPFNAPHHDGAPRYGTGALPRSEQLNRELLWFSNIHPPNTLDDMEDVARAFEKILG